MRIGKRSWLAVVTTAAFLVSGTATAVATTSDEDAASNRVAVQSSVGTGVPLATEELPPSSPRVPAYLCVDSGAYLVDPANPSVIQGGVNGVYVELLWPDVNTYPPYQTGVTGSGGNSDGRWTFNTALSWNTAGYYVEFDKATLDAALEPGYTIVSGGASGDGLVFGPFPKEASGMCIQANLFINGTAKSETTEPGGESGGGGSVGGAPPELTLEKGVKDLSTGAIADLIEYPYSETKTAETVTARLSNTSGETVQGISFQDVTNAGSAVQWDKCTKYCATGNLLGTYTFASKTPTSPETLTGVLGALGNNQRLDCEGTLDAVGVRAGNAHKDTVTMKASGDFEGETIATATFEAKAKPDDPGTGPGGQSSPTWLTKSPATVQCPAEGDQCTVSWDIVAYNGSSQNVNLATLTDVTSKEVYDVEATVHAPVAQLAVGAGYTLALGADGTVWAFGSNTDGKLGIGANYTSSTRIPTRVEFNYTGEGLHTGETVIQVVAANNTSFALTSEGRVYAWGLNAVGQAGVGDRDTKPRLVPNLPSDVTYIAGGNGFTLALTASGDVYSWGSATNGVLGNGQTSGTDFPPTKIDAFAGDPVIQISAGLEHALAVTASGAIYAWGNNTNGQLGTGVAGGNQSTPTKLTLSEQFVQIAAGATHSMALTASGDVYTWGNNANGRTGLGTTTGNQPTPTKVDSLAGVSQITAGSLNSFALTSDGAVWAWGRNNQGQLGVGSTLPANASTPTKVTTVPSGVDVLELRAHSSSSHFLLLGSDGKLYGWGANSSGQLGATNYGNNVFSLTPVVGSGSVPLDLGTTDDLDVMVEASPTRDIVVSQLPDGCTEDDGTPQCAPREVTFLERKYVSTEHEENGALNLRPHSRAFVTVSGKVDRGAKGFTIGNQAYYDSDQAPFGTAPELKPLFPEFDKDAEPWASDPWAYGFWEDNAACAPGTGSQCGQVWASVDKSENAGIIRGVVSRETDDQGGIVVAGGVTVELYKGDPASGGALVDSTNTNGQGIYSFDALVGSNYYVKFMKDTLPEAPAGKGWFWDTAFVINPINSDGVSLPRAVLKGSVTNQNAKAKLQDVATADMSVKKGWKNPAGDIVDQVTYGGDTAGQSETITVEVVNTGDDPLGTFGFEDTTILGDNVAWSSCEVLSKDREPTGATYDFAPGDAEQPDVALTGLTLEVEEILSCEGTLLLDRVGNVGHQDTVAITAQGKAGGTLNDIGTFTAEASDGQLEVEKGILVDEGKPSEKIESNHYIPYGTNETVTVRVTNGGSSGLSGFDIQDATVEGPDVTGLTCSWIADPLAPSESADCSGSLAMDAYVHQDTVTVTALDDDGGVYKTFADFKAQSSGSLPRAGMIGIWGLVIAGGVLAAVAAIARRKQTTYAPRH